MSKGFASELARASARPDIDELRASLTVYHDWSARNREHSTQDWPDELDIWFDGGADADRGLALVMLAAATYDDPQFLALVAAGLLENLLSRKNRPSEEFFERILAEARKNKRFRWMLSGAWRTGMISEQAHALKQAVGTLTCDAPLPPRPWA